MPVYKFPGVPVENGNPYHAYFFLKDYCYSTPNWRFRRSQYTHPDNKEKTYHYLYGECMYT